MTWPRDNPSPRILRNPHESSRKNCGQVDQWKSAARNDYSSYFRRGSWHGFCGYFGHSANCNDPWWQIWEPISLWQREQNTKMSFWIKFDYLKLTEIDNIYNLQQHTTTNLPRSNPDSETTRDSETTVQKLRFRNYDSETIPDSETTVQKLPRFRNYGSETTVQKLPFRNYGSETTAQKLRLRKPWQPMLSMTQMQIQHYFLSNLGFPRLGNSCFQSKLHFFYQQNFSSRDWFGEILLLCIL